MPHYIVEIRLPGVGRSEVARVARVLKSANDRLANIARVVTASVGRDDGRLVCTVEAPTADAVRYLMSTALLPSGRIGEITTVLGPPDMGPDLENPGPAIVMEP
ncbi:MAG TPA: hypothetical protein VHK65_14925 [Candidatus Dormibacteraeota bacterium]|nr:hypothetical protein [Candidatus Dormibacteraeota bacterium]